MEHDDRRMRVAQILEGEEFCPERLGRGDVARLERGEHRHRQMRRDGDRPGGEAGEPELREMHDRRPLAHAADDALRAGRLDDRGEIGVLRRVLPLHRILDRTDHAVGEERGDVLRREIRLGADIGDDRLAVGVGETAKPGGDAGRPGRARHRQRHRGREIERLQDRDLVERLAEIGADRRDHPGVRRARCRTAPRASADIRAGRDCRNWRCRHRGRSRRRRPPSSRRSSGSRRSTPRRSGRGPAAARRSPSARGRRGDGIRLHGRESRLQGGKGPAIIIGQSARHNRGKRYNARPVDARRAAPG